MDHRRTVSFNRLLDYRSHGQLLVMGDEDRGALLREVLDGSPSRETWQAVCELFASWPENEARRQHLELAEEGLAGWDDALRSLHSSSALLFDGQRLSSLAILVRTVRIYRREQKGSSELMAVAVSEHARRIASLSIIRSEISTEAWRAMTESPFLAGLRHLHVSGTVLHGGDIRRLMESSALARLESLELIDMGLTEARLEGARETMALAGLRHLDLSRNLLGDEGVLLLAKAPWLAGIQRLVLRRSHVTASGMTSLLQSPFARRITYLDLSENLVDGEERAALRKLAQDRRMKVLI